MATTTRRARVLVILATAASLATACTTGESIREPIAASLVVRDAAACASGCALDAPLLVGGEIVADVLTEVELDRLEARALDPGVVSAWVEPVRLCCAEGVGASCFRMDAAEQACGGEITERPRVVMRGLRVGETAIELLDEGRVLETVELRVEDAIEVNVVPATTTVDSPDVILAPQQPPQWIDGRLQSLELRAGQVARLWLVAISPDGQRLLAGTGPSAMIGDPRIAEVGPATGVCSGAIAGGPLVVVEGVGSGATELVVRAGSAMTTLPVEVEGECAPAEGRLEPTVVACESDADCVPAGCCHPSTCVAPGDAPSCQGVACTLECRAGTLDCGGRCLCLQGRCAAFIPTLDPACQPDGGAPPVGRPF